MIRIAVQRGAVRHVKADVLIHLVFEGWQKSGEELKVLRTLTGADLIPEGGTGFAGKERETLLLFPRNLSTPRLLLVGAGAHGNWSRERLRRGGATAAKAARGMGLRTASFIEPEKGVTAALATEPGEDPAELYGCALAEGVFLGLYRYDKYQTRKNPASEILSRISFITDSPSREKAIARGIGFATLVCEATCFARDLENAPGNEIYPESLAAAARKAGRRSGFKVSVFDERKIRSLGMGGLLGVARGSRRPPRLLVMEYRGRGSGRPQAAPGKGPVVLVGKGVTFDSGGISIKPSAGMAEMKMDMSGGAVVIAAMQAAARLKLPVHIIGIVPATENLPGGSALRPGDILRHHNGMTSEVDNTDAEGRLILADALSYARRFDPALVIDLATLTGAVVVALGHVATGMMGNDAEAMRLLKDSGERTYERVWELPMFEEYEALIKSEIADVKNTGGRWGGAITAAMFLRKFTGSYGWVHLDIAGTSIIEEPTDYTGRGGSGVGVRLLVDFLRRRSARGSDPKQKGAGVVRTTLMMGSAIVLALAAVTVSARGQFRPPRSEQGPQVLFYEALPLPGEGDSLRQRIDIHYRIDREFFVPVRDPDGRSAFHRSGEIVVELADSTGGIATRSMQALEIPEGDADRKPLGVRWEQGIFPLMVPPGRYRILMTVEDQESRRSILDSSRFVRTSSRTTAGLGTASVVLIAPPRDAKGIPGELTLMNYGEEVLFGRPAALLVVWTSTGGRDSLLSVKYSFTEEPASSEDRPFLPPDQEVLVPVHRGVKFAPWTDSSRAAYRLSRDAPGATCAAVVPVPFARLLLRSFRMTFSLSSGSDRYEVVRKGRAVWPDMPFSLKEIDNALDALRYITTESELDSLRRGNLEARRGNLEGFWRSKGGKHETAFNEVMTEYYRRVDLAMRTFGTLRQPDGFRSDRGRIYVLYGPPTTTDRTLNPVSGFQEIWTYGHLKKQFMFVDQNKSGNYVLVSTTAL